MSSLRIAGAQELGNCALSRFLVDRFGSTGWANLNGAIEIISAVGNGTTFNIYLPLAGEAPPAGVVTGPLS